MRKKTELEPGDYVINTNKTMIGIVISYDKTFLHDHKYVWVKWFGNEWDDPDSTKHIRYYLSQDELPKLHLRPARKNENL